MAKGEIIIKDGFSKPIIEAISQMNNEMNLKTDAFFAKIESSFTKRFSAMDKNLQSVIKEVDEKFQVLNKVTTILEKQNATLFEAIGEVSNKIIKQEEKINNLEAFRNSNRKLGG